MLTIGVVGFKMMAYISSNSFAFAMSPFLVYSMASSFAADTQCQPSTIWYLPGLTSDGHKYNG